MNISEQYLTIVKHIDSTVNQYPLNQAGDELLLQHLVDLMPAFKQLLDNWGFAPIPSKLTLREFLNKYHKL